jgi:hypothetical protein
MASRGSSQCSYSGAENQIARSVISISPLIRVAPRRHLRFLLVRMNQQ